jgi:SAM-dependent methyltransferase
MKASLRPLFRHALAKRFIRRSLLRESHAIDIGCGRGDFVFWLARQGYYVQGFEFSEVSVASFRATQASGHYPRVQLHAQDFFSFSDPQCVDLISCFEVLEHIEDDGCAVRTIYSWLKPGGYAIISVPAHMRMWGSDDNVYGHVRRYERQQLVDLFKQNGFSLVQFSAYGFPWMNILKKIRELQVRVHPPRFYTSSHTAEVGTKHSGVGFFRSGIWYLLFNPLTFYPLVQFSKLFHRLDIAEGYFLVAQRPTISSQ